MFVWAKVSKAPFAGVAGMSSLELSKFLVEKAQVATSPGSGFGPGGEGYVRFALIENEQRINQAVRNLRGLV